MADNFSLDDILAEVDTKRAKRDPSPRHSPSVTEILSEEKIKSAAHRTQTKASPSEDFKLNWDKVQSARQNEKNEKNAKKTQPDPSGTTSTSFSRKPASTTPSKTTSTIGSAKDAAKPQPSAFGNSVGKSGTEASKPQTPLFGSSNTKPGNGASKHPTVSFGSTGTKPGTEATKPQTPLFGSSNAKPGTEATKPQTPLFGSSNTKPGTGTAKPQAPLFGSSNTKPGTGTAKPQTPSFGGSNTKPGTGTTKAQLSPSSNKNTKPGSLSGAAVSVRDSKLPGASSQSAVTRKSQSAHSKVNWEGRQKKDKASDLIWEPGYVRDKTGDLIWEGNRDRSKRDDEVWEIAREALDAEAGITDPAALDAEAGITGSETSQPTYEKTEEVNQPQAQTAEVQVAPEQGSKRQPKKEDPEDKRLKRMEKQFQRELELDDPDDLIDAINPMDIGEITGDFGSIMGGDTVGLAGNDLKKLAGTKDPETVRTDRIVIPPRPAIRPQEPEKEYPTLENDLKQPGSAASEPREAAEPVKTYIPQQEKPQKESAEYHRRSNTGFLEQLNQSLAKQKAADQKLKQTLDFRQDDGNSIEKIKAPEQGLNLDYSKKIIEATGAIPTSDSNLIRKITDEQNEKKKRSIRNFVLDEEDEEESPEPEEDSLEFDSYDTTGKIWSDLCESHKGLKTRFILLLIVTAATVIAALFNDLGQGLTFNLFGMEVNFLSRRVNPEGYIFFTLIAGVLGMLFCGALLSSGFSKLFHGKADCDSVCAVSCTVSILISLLHLSNFDYLQRGKAFIYIPAALLALLFNTGGKLMMIVRAKQCFRFISGDSVKYSVTMVEENLAASQFTKGLIREIPCLAAMRKTEFLTDFLHNSYCEDSADRICRILTPAGLAGAVLAGVLAYFMPNGFEGMENNLFWSTSVLTGVLTLLCPFAVMFMVNIPLSRANHALAKRDSVVQGFSAVEDYSGVNSVMVDASTLFPAGSAYYTKIKHCRHRNSISNINVDQAIILAGSLAIKSGSVLSKAFRDTVVDRDDILVNVENCVYEDNMGVLGWYGNKRLIMGNREHMLHHDIKVPDMNKINQQLRGGNKDGGGEVIYLAVAGELVLIMLVELIPNNEIKEQLQKLVKRDVHLVVKTTDSIVTVAKIAEVFDIDPTYIKVLPGVSHEQFSEVTRYVSRGDGAISCNGTFTSFSSAILAAKEMMMDIGIGKGIMLAGAVLGAICAVLLGIFANTSLLSPAAVMLWNTGWFLLGAAAQMIRRY